MPESIPASAYIGRIYRKINPPGKEERILFASSSEFWHRWLDGEWTPYAYRVVDDGLVLNWGNGFTPRCFFNGSNQSSSIFVEPGPKDYCWELTNEQFNRSSSGDRSDYPDESHG